MRRAGAAAAALLLVLSQLSCATAGYSPDARSMPAARVGLRPEYRVFYDELTDYGDWVLVEPYGYVFSPNTRFQTWSPYFDGFWSPSDSYGWVWVSAEPFGWATYHYGRWFQDSYRGWVWVPGLDWAPAWVSWVGTNDLVGWAPLTPGSGFDALPRATSVQFVARSDLGATDLKSKLLTRTEAAGALEQARPIENLEEVNHVEVNRGPTIEWVEEAAGPLKRPRTEDVFSPSPAKPATIDARRNRTIIQQKQAQPDVITILKAAHGHAKAPQKAPAPASPKAPPDSTR